MTNHVIYIFVRGLAGKKPLFCILHSSKRKHTGHATNPGLRAEQIHLPALNPHTLSSTHR
jgi:hypothetical protein